MGEGRVARGGVSHRPVVAPILAANAGRPHLREHVDAVKDDGPAEHAAVKGREVERGDEDVKGRHAERADRVQLEDARHDEEERVGHEALRGHDEEVDGEGDVARDAVLRAHDDRGGNAVRHQDLAHRRQQQERPKHEEHHAARYQTTRERGAGQPCVRPARSGGSSRPGGGRTRG